MDSQARRAVKQKRTANDLDSRAGPNLSGERGIVRKGQAEDEGRPEIKDEPRLTDNVDVVLDNALQLVLELL